MTKIECEKRLYDEVKPRWDLTKWLSLKTRISLTSFFYNVWFQNDVLEYAKRWDMKSVKYLMNKYIYCWWKICWGLKKRRLNEIALLTK